MDDMATNKQIDTAEPVVRVRDLKSEEEEFMASKDGKTMRWAFFFLAIAYMWPYFTTLGSQTFLQVAFPNVKTIGFEIMLAGTLPESGSYVLTLLLGAHRTRWLGKFLSAPSCILFCLFRLL